MEREDFKIGMTIYHKDVYEYREPLKVIGIAIEKDKIAVTIEGSFPDNIASLSNGLITMIWLPMEGASTIYNYRQHHGKV